MRILFTADPHFRDLPEGEHYVRGEIYDLRPDQCHKWMSVLGIAVTAPPEAPETSDPGELPASHLLAETDAGEPAPAATASPDEAP
jgi:hypothetical protein